jgi:hypothetical protein
VSDDYNANFKVSLAVDSSSEVGAKRLIAAINAYWRARGKRANARALPSSRRRAYWVVRSDMINGRPR